MEQPDDAATPLLGFYLKNTKTLMQKDVCASTFIIYNKQEMGST